MKRYINSKSIPLLVLMSSLVAVVLRIWTRGGGPDEAGLFAAKPLAWALLWLLTAATAAAVIYAVWGLKKPGSYRDNYPKSTVAGLCSAPVAVAFLVSGYAQLRDSVGYMVPGTSFVDTLTGIFGLVAGGCLLLVSVHRIMGKKPFFALNGLVCLYLALRLFNRCQLWSNEPQLSLVVFPFMASTTLMLSAYHRVCFDVDLGRRPWAALWTLMSVFLCLVAMLSFEEPLYYGLCALWKMTDLCSMRPLKRRPQEEQPVTAQEPPASEEAQ